MGIDKYSINDCAAALFAPGGGRAEARLTILPAHEPADSGSMRSVRVRGEVDAAGKED